MNAVFLAFERASVFGLVALVVALSAQVALNGRVPASWRVWIWRAAMLQTALALVPLAPLRLAVLPPRPPVATPVAEGKSLAAPRPIENERPQSLPLPARRSSPSPHTAPASPPASSRLEAIAPTPRVEAIGSGQPMNWRPFLLGFYALGLGFQLVALARSFRRVRQMLRACTPLENAAIKIQVGEIARRMRVAPLPRLLQSENGAPFLTGVFRPVIVLPRALLSQNDDLEAVLCHELAHLKRRDLAWNALLWLIQSAFWFHPLIWAARRFLALETESACDEIVLGSTCITPQSYGALLLNTMKTEHTPLTAGVADGFFALKTRLVRLNRTPIRPHRAVRVAFAAALCLAFGALVPLRFVARAQTETPVSPLQKAVGGTVVDEGGKPVAGATVYAMRSRDNGGKPLETTVSDANGRFRFSFQATAPFALDIFADAGARGLARHYTFLGSRRKSSLVLKVSPGARTRLQVFDPRGRPAAGLTLRLWRLVPSANSWLALPRPILQTMRATTDARGVAIFPPLPAKMLAQFVVDDERDVPTRYGSGDRRGKRFAPLSSEDAVTLEAPETRKTIRLLSPVHLVGRVSLPDGRGAGNVLVLARRINAAEAAGRTHEREQLIAQTRSNARGLYVLYGLRPGQYWVWIYPEKRLTRDWVGPIVQKTFASGVYVQNFALSRGAIIQGVVLAQNTKEPVRGQTMGLHGAQGNNHQYTITDARGFFRFRALGGTQHLWVHANGSNSPQPGLALPAKSEFDFSIKNGEKRDFRIEMPLKPVIKPVTGTVVGPDGNPVAGALVSVEGLGGMRDFGTHTRMRSDQNGRFSIAAKQVSQPARLFAQTPDMVTLHGTVVQSGDEVTLRLERDALAGFEGQILDQKTRKPLEGARIYLRFVDIGGIYSIEPAKGTLENGRFSSGTMTRSDAGGKFSFPKLRPFRAYYLQARLDGYQPVDIAPAPLRRGQTQRPTILMPPLRASLSGRVVRADGTPARGFQVLLDDGKGVSTKNDGTFLMPRVLDEKFRLYVIAPNRGESWGPVWTRGGRTDVVFRLTDALRSPARSSAPWQRARSERKNLVGREAPPLRVSGWIGQPVSLRGKVTLLSFSSFIPASESLNDFARSFASRGVQVVGVQSPRRIGKQRAKTLAELQNYQEASDIAYPLALDAPLPKAGEFLWVTGQSAAFYQGARFVVIGRDGKIAFVGDDAADAMRAALALTR